jgi:hypothetical protein
MEFWKGSFAPVAKHRLYTGDVANHLQIVSVEKVDAEADLSDRIDQEIDPEDLEELGEGTYTYLVKVAWVNGGQAYSFIVRSEEPILEVSKASKMIQDYFQSK